MKVPFFCALLVAASVSAVPNDLDPIFAPPLNPNAGIMAMACQPDGKIIVAGGWSTVGASGHSRIARLNPVTGAVDESYTTTIGGGGQVKVLRFRRDGKLYVAGSFSSVNGTARGRVARLNADGTLDTTFADPQVTGGFQVYSLVEQSDGKVIIGGSFTAVNGTARVNMARLNDDGSLDTSYNPAPNGFVQSLALLPNDQVLAGGTFYAIAGLANFTRYGIVILNTDGTADSTALPLVVHGTLALQPDGKILLSGKFDQLGGTYYWGMARMNANRTLDTTFLPRLGKLPDTNPAAASSIAMQANGKIIVGGEFAAIGGDETGETGTPMKRLARLNNDGTLDTTLPNPNFDGPVQGGLVQSVLIDARGGLLVGGYINSLNGSAITSLVRYEDELPTEALSITNSNARIQWLRGGSAAEAESVWFEQSTDGGATYTLLGRGTRISGGWELTGLSLPGSVRIRASALCVGGEFNGSASLMQTVDDFPLVPPQLVVEQPENTALTHNSSIIDLGNVVSGTTGNPVTFTIRNSGSGLLKRLQLSVDGTHASDFAITQSPTTELNAGASTTFAITFSPAARNARSATLRIGSNDPTAPVFIIGLTGTGVASPNADLSGIGLPSPQTLAPAFAVNSLSYMTNVIFNKTSIVITPTAVNPASTIRVNGTVVASGANSAPINLTTGTNPINIDVTAEDGVAVKNYVLTVVRAAASAPGDLDLGFNSYIDASALSLALQSDGRLLVGGFFAQLGAPAGNPGSINRNSLARINPDATFDTFDPLNPGSIPYAIHLLGNGQMILGGVLQGWSTDPSSQGIALLNADGTRVTSFGGNANGVVMQIAAVPGGKFVIVGGFTSVQFGGAASASTRNYMARLNANGTLDTAFSPSADAPVRAVVVQADGKIIVGGQMTMVGSTTVNRLARINTNGTVDTTFNEPVLDGDVYTLALQPDGKVLVGGIFSAGNGLVRLNTNGTLDTSFDQGASVPNGARQVTCLALQDDGKVVVGGYGTDERSGLERQNADGTLDTSFKATIAGANPIARALVIDEVGRIVVVGDFTSVNGLPRARIARLEGGAPQTLAPVSGTLVEWSRPGLPVASAVAFDISPDSGTTWTSIDATGTRVGNVWQGTISTALPLTGGLLRARATIPGGLYGEMAFLSTYTPPAAEIAVEQPVNNDRDDGDTINIGSLGLNVTNPTVFTLRNVGGQNLTNIAVTITGTNAAMFTLIDAPDPTVAPLESTTFTVQAKLTTVGAKTATINIASSDADENPFNIVMNATGVAAVLPTATTVAASNVTFGVGTVPNIADATLNGTVDAKGQLRDISFDYGLTTAYGSNIPATPATLNTTGATAVSADLHDLPPHTTYHFRVRADGDLGNALGANKTFTTPNHFPVAANDTAINLPSAAVTIDVLNNDDDADNDTLTITAKTAVTPSTAGTVAIVSNQLVFTASAAFGTGPNTSATFGYTVSDGFAGTATASVSVTPGSAFIDVPSVSLPSAGTTYPVELTTVGSWAVTEALTWVTVSPSSGIGSRTVNVTLLPNTALAARTGTVKIGGVAHTITQAGVLAPVVSPAVADTGSFNTVVGARRFSVSIPCTNFPVTFTVASGTLPPGLTLNSTTGVISGIPSAGGTTAAPTKAYPLTIKATNLKGSSITPSFTINVHALPAGVIGSWQGIVSPHATVHYTAAASLGARFELTTSGNGSFTATLYEGVTKKSVTGTLEVVLATKQTPTLNAVLPGTSLALALTLDGNTRTLTGTLSDTVNSTPVNAWRNTWTTTAPANKATAFMGLHNVYLANTDTLNGPQGYGYATFNIAENTGVLSITGKLADETKTTATPMTTTFVGPQGQVLLYLPLYGNRGSLCGTLTVDHSITGDNQVQGTLSWVKPAPLPTSTDTVYKSGFGPLVVAAEGNLYVAPGKGLRVMGAVPPVLPATTNSSLTFDLGGLAASFTQNVLIKNPSPTGLTNTASVTAFNAALTPNPNPNKVAMPVLTASSGLFSGSFIIAGTPARTAPYYGLIVRDVTAGTDVTQGFGFFLLPTVPVSPLTVTSSPKLSGTVRFTAP